LDISCFEATSTQGYLNRRQYECNRSYSFPIWMPWAQQTRGPRKYHQKSYEKEIQKNIKNVGVAWSECALFVLYFDNWS